MIDPDAPGTARAGEGGGDTQSCVSEPDMRMMYGSDIGALEARLYRELTPAMMRALSYTSTQVEAWKSSHGHVETDGEGVYRGYVLRYVRMGLPYWLALNLMCSLLGLLWSPLD